MWFRTTAKYDLDQLTTNSGAGSYTKMIFAKDFQHIVFTVLSAGSNCTMTIKFYGSTQEARPDLSAAASSTNDYSTIQIIDLKTGSAINGNTGLVITADGLTQYEANINAQTRVWVVCTAFTKGAANVSALLTDNQ